MDIVGFISELFSARSSGDRSERGDQKKPEKTSGKSGNFEAIDVEKPLWDQETYLGRLRHFAFITDIRTVIVPSKKLLEAKQLLADYK